MANHKKEKKSFSLVQDTRLSWEEEPSVVGEHQCYVNNENEARSFIGRQGYEIPALDAWLVCGSDLELRFRLVPA